MTNNGGCSQRCYDLYNSFHCGCDTGYTIQNTHDSCPGNYDCSQQKADIVFVVDASGSIKDMGAGNWDLILQFIRHLADSLNIGTDGVRIGLVVFSLHAENHFYLNQYFDKPSLDTAILNTPYFHSFTNTSGGLYRMMHEQFTAERGDRADVPNIAVLITDGIANKDEQLTLPYAEEAIARGIHMMVVGITSAVDMAQIKAMSSPPREKDKQYYLLESFSALSVPQGSAGRKKRSTGNDVDVAGMIRAEMCAVTQQRCQGLMADVLFLVDSSGSIRDANPADQSYDNWALTLDFLDTFVRDITIGEDFAKVALAVFSQTAQPVFHFNTYSDKATILNAIKDAPFLGGQTNTASALRLAREEMLTAAKGHRTNRPNVVIILTDGEPTLDTHLTEAAAYALQNMQSTQVFAIGVTDKINAATLQMLSSSPRELGTNYFVAADFKALKDVEAAVSTTTCADSKEFCYHTEEEGRVCLCVYDECNIVPLNGTTCGDVNECEVNNGGCYWACENTAGSYFCKCPAGFTLAPDNKACQDVNECLVSTPCQAGEVCTNTWGGHLCTAVSQGGQSAPLVAVAAGEEGSSDEYSMGTVLLTSVLSALVVASVCALIVVTLRRRWRDAAAEQAAAVGGKSYEYNGYNSYDSAMFGSVRGINKTLKSLEPNSAANTSCSTISVDECNSSYASSL